MHNYLPLTKRSRRILEQTMRHLTYASRGLDRLSLAEYQRLRVVVDQRYPAVDMPVLLQGLRWLADAIQVRLQQEG